MLVLLFLCIFAITLTDTFQEDFDVLLLQYLCKYQANKNWYIFAPSVKDLLVYAVSTKRLNETLLDGWHGLYQSDRVYFLCNVTEHISAWVELRAKGDERSTSMDDESDRQIDR